MHKLGQFHKFKEDDKSRSVSNMIRCDVVYNVIVLHYKQCLQKASAIKMEFDLE